MGSVILEKVVRRHDLSKKLNEAKVETLQIMWRKRIPDSIPDCENSKGRLLLSLVDL